MTPDQNGWLPIETAPKDRPILVFGQPTDIENCRFLKPAVYAAYWDEIDRSFCIKGATWLGPFIDPTHWMLEPQPPVSHLTLGTSPVTTSGKPETVAPSSAVSGANSASVTP